MSRVKDNREVKGDWFIIKFVKTEKTFNTNVTHSTCLSQSCQVTNEPSQVFDSELEGYLSFWSCFYDSLGCPGSLSYCCVECFVSLMARSSHESLFALTLSCQLITQISKRPFHETVTGSAVVTPRVQEEVGFASLTVLSNPVLTAVLTYSSWSRSGVIVCCLIKDTRRWPLIAITLNALGLRSPWLVIVKRKTGVTGVALSVVSTNTLWADHAFN